MKKILFIIFICIFMCNYVSADTHDVQAKYEKEYNVELFTVKLDNNTKTLNIDEYTLEFTTSLKDIEVVVIKPESEENNYIKAFTKNNNNYYLGFFKDDKKISNSDINIKIKNNNKILNIYDNLGNLIKSSDETINLNSNNYFITITDNKNIEDENIKDEYKITDINKIASELEEIGNKATITVYNNKNIEVENNAPLGTGYRVLVNESGIIKGYKIVVKGDITGDARINLNDITRLYHYYKKIEQMNEPFILAGDVAKNDIINLNDITKIYHYYKKLISQL